MTNKFIINAENPLLAKFIAILLSILALSWLVYNYYAGDHILANQGLGWDGTTYGALAQSNPPDIIKNQSLAEYTVQRIMPSIAVHYLGHLLNYNLDLPTEQVHAFYLYNSLLLAISAVFLYLIAKHLRWRTPIIFLAFTAIFLNYAVLKQFLFYPVLTDASAFALGIISFYFYLRNHWWLLLLTTLIASFVFPSMLYTGLTLLAFKIKSDDTEYSPTLKINTLISAIIAAGITAAALFIVINSHFTFPPIIPSAVIPIHKLLFPFSIICLFSYVFLYTRYLFDYRCIVHACKHDIYWPRILTVILLYLALKYTITLFSNGTAGAFTPLSYIPAILMLAVINPGISLLSHILYFGPVTLLTLFFWKDIAASIKQKGLSLILLMALFLILSLDSESRKLVYVWPVFAILTCDILNKYSIPFLFSYILIFISLVMSRFYLPLNAKFWGALGAIGPWTPFSVYCIYLISALATGVFLYWLLKKFRINTPI